MNIVDIAKAVAPDAKLEVIGVRPGEKMHEQMISNQDAPYTYEYDDFYKILPAINGWHLDPKRISAGKLVEPTFEYSSDKNPFWMTSHELIAWIKNEYKGEQ